MAYGTPETLFVQAGFSSETVGGNEEKRDESLIVCLVLPYRYKGLSVLVTISLTIL